MNVADRAAGAVIGALAMPLDSVLIGTTTSQNSAKIMATGSQGILTQSPAVTIQE